MAPRWLSPNPEKAWAERWLLGYSVAWMLAVALVIVTGWIHTWGDWGYLLFSLTLGGAAVLGPWLWPGRPDRGRPVWECWWFKLNAWVFVLVCFGTYVGTHYFFELMGMRYGFPVTWMLQADMGRTQQTVPVFMYPLTQAYFVTYFVAAPIALRRLGGALGRGWLGRALVVLVLGYGIAWMETFAMANDGLSAYFAYADKDKMLRFGSLGYSAYFLVGLPLVIRIDEHHERWPLRRVMTEAVAACMMILLLLELWSAIVGPL